MITGNTIIGSTSIERNLTDGYIPVILDDLGQKYKDMILDYEEKQKRINELEREIEDIYANDGRL